MIENEALTELEELRPQFGELKSMLREQQIVNEKMTRKAMKGDYGKVRRDIVASVVFEIVAIPLQMWLLPYLGLPAWFVAVSLLFLLTALAASVYSLRRYASANMMTGNLTEVALDIVRYKRFGIYWFFYAIPFLVFWVSFFFYYVTRGQESEFIRGVVWGGIIGGVIGLTLGFVNYAQNLKRMNRILKQIKEVKGNA